MAYQSAHTGPEVDAAVEMLSQIQEARDATAEDRAEVQVDTQEVHANAVQVASLAVTVTNQAETVQTLATEVEQAHFDTVNVAAAAVQARDIAVDSASLAQAAQASATASEQTTTAAVEQAIDAADIVTALAPQVSDDAASAASSASSAAASAASAAAVVTGGTATLTPSPGKIPLADGSGKIDDAWMPTSIARSSSVAAATQDAALAKTRTAPFLEPAVSNPSTRFDGSALQIGDRYFNTTAQGEYLYTNVGWVLNDAAAAVDIVEARLDGLDADISVSSSADGIPRADGEGVIDIGWIPSSLTRASDLASKTDPAKGAALVGFDGGTTADVLDNAKSLANYAALRSYTGRAATVQIIDSERSGRFRKVATSVGAYVDDGAVTIVAVNGLVWQRLNSDITHLSWWEIAGLPDVSSLLLKAVALGKPVILPAGQINMQVSLPSGAVIRGQGKSKTLIKPPSGNTSNAINISGVNGVVLEDFKVQGSATAKEGEDLGLIHCSNGFYNVQLRELEVIQGSQNGIVMVGGLDSNERSVIENCAVYSNRFDGVRLSEVKHVDIITNQVHHNSHMGIALQSSIWPPVAYSIDDVLISGNRVYNNIGAGIYVMPLIMGGTNIYTNFTYSFTEQQYCKNIRCTENQVYSNSASGIMAGGAFCTYADNVCIGNGTSGDGYAGMVVSCYGSSATGNVCTGNATYGIDIGGCQHTTVSGNTAVLNAVGKTFAIGMNLGACAFCTVTGNTVANNGPNTANSYQMMIAGWDGDGLYSYELLGSQNLVANNNIKGFSNNYGIYIRHNAAYHQVVNNYIGQVSRLNAIVNESDFSQTTHTITGNVHDISTVAGGVTLASAAALVVDDFNSEFIVTGTTNITSIVTKSNNDNSGKIVAAKMTALGSGYTSKPTVTISGGGGTGATATAELGRSGQILGINIKTTGSGYTSNPTITIGTDGGGTGAAATAVFGLKNQTGRRITLQFEGVLTVTVNGMVSSYTAAAGSTLTLEGRKNGNGQWVEICRSQ